MKSPVFIVGMPRSGTTFLSNIVNSSREIFFGPETHVFSVYENWKRNSDCVPFNVFFFSERNFFFKYFDFSKKEVDNLLKTTTGAGPIEVLETISIFEASKSGSFRWGEKTPSHLENLNELLFSFPNAKVVNVLRDPRDIFDSIDRVNWNKSSKNAFVFCKRYSKYVNKMELNHPNVISVRYEDLLLDDKSELKRVFRFLDISFDESKISSFGRIDNINFNPKKEPWKNNSLKSKILSDNSYKWKKSDSISFVNRYLSWRLKDDISKLGYDSVSFSINVYYYHLISILHFIFIKLKLV